MSWLHPVTHASITRSSQPLVGASRKRSKEDEDYLGAILKVRVFDCVICTATVVSIHTCFVCETQANKYGKKLYVMDARPKINAYANIVSNAQTAICCGYETGYLGTITLRYFIEKDLTTLLFQ